MTSEKKCPVCGTSKWNYDVVDFATGAVFCDGCMFDVRAAGKDNGLMVWEGTTMVFPNTKNFNKAITAAKAARV
jgi:hypothetical protein